MGKQVSDAKNVLASRGMKYRVPITGERVGSRWALLRGAFSAARKFGFWRVVRSF